MDTELRLAELFRTLDVNFTRLVELPQGESESEWIAYHMSLFFKHTKRLVTIMKAFCTMEICPTMAITNDRYIILRTVDDGDENYADLDASDLSVSACASDPEDGQVPSADEYTDAVMDWCYERLGSRELFPVDSENKFPADFKVRCRHMLRRLLHIYLHIYNTHFDIILKNFLVHFNTSFKYMVEFGLRHEILREDDVSPMMNAVKYWRSAAQN